MTTKPKLHPATTVSNIKSFIPVTLEMESDQYFSWSELFKIHCKAFQVIDHLSPRPAASSKSTASTAGKETETPKPKDDWDRLDVIVLQWIYGTISNDILHTILQPNTTAYDAWTTVENIFQDNKSSRAIHLLHKFSNTRLNGFPNVSAYCQVLKILADQLANVNAPVIIQAFNAIFVELLLCTFSSNHVMEVNKNITLVNFQSIPYPVFPGGAIVGCSAGFLNVPKIKGTHTAMKSGMLAAESAFGVLQKGSNMETYWESLKNSWIWEELHRARNYRPAFEYGLLPGMAISALEHYLLKGRAPYTLKHGKPDHEATNEASRYSPIEYPKPDGIVSFDVPTSLYRSNTNHNHDQPAHLHLRDSEVPELVNLPKYAGPESRYCPARVYEYVSDDNGQLKLQINAQNCLHCKACDIKDPKQNIEWTVPEGGGGPKYSVM